MIPEFAMMVLYEFMNQLMESSTCKYLTFPVSPKYCRYRSPSFMMMRSSCVRYLAALGSSFRSWVSYGSFRIFSLRFLRTGSWSWYGLRLRGKLVSLWSWRRCSCSGSWMLLQTKGRFSGWEMVWAVSLLGSEFCSWVV